MMDLLGISGSPRKEARSGVHRLVQTVLEHTGCDFELVSMRGKIMIESRSPTGYQATGPERQPVYCPACACRAGKRRPAT